ncbi:putative signal peptide and transmembrane protein [Rhodopirellula islandica]|uniref:Signal peptide and transmembrane protein n=1 Tax=Rhodopirellula islandica TaxID=595434 RepID=A0A0J1BD03_RHOIS|nr:hypothetical protein [Rhodopirellula islandica]KLU04468.1 putative signal peptide and transmembrane protein [Rhodopirellula islandica]
MNVLNLRRALAVLCCLTLGTAVGCPSQPTTALEDADQSAIDAYQAEQEKDLASMDGTLETKP